MSNPVVIAIDGPAASGKTTLAQQLACLLGYLYFDTGVMYRAVTLATLRAGVDLADEERVAEIAREVVIDVYPPTTNDGRPSTVYLDGKDVTWELYSSEIDATVSIPSANMGVREALTTQQRRIAVERGPVVMVGRDIGTVVCPDAEVKIYLDASAEARARRRWLQYCDNRQEKNREEILEAMHRRDQWDSQRLIAPLRPAEDAEVIDTTEMTASEVLTRVVEVIRAHFQDGENTQGDEDGS